MAGPESSTSVRRIRARQREAEAVDLRLAGATYEQIAERLGYQNRSGPKRAIERALGRLTPPEDLERLRYIEYMRLERLHLTFWPEALRRDHAAANQVRALSDCRCKLLGLWAPARQELSGPGGGPIPYATFTEAELDSEFARLLGDFARAEEAYLDLRPADLPRGFRPPLRLDPGPEAD